MSFMSFIRPKFTVLLIFFVVVSNHLSLPQGANFLPKRRSDVSIQRSPSHIGYIASEMDDWKVEMRVKMSGEDNSVYVDGIDLITDGVLSV